MRWGDCTRRIYFFSRSRYMYKSRSGSEKGDSLLSRVARVTTLAPRS